MRHRAGNAPKRAVHALNCRRDSSAACQELGPGAGARVASVRTTRDQARAPRERVGRMKMLHGTIAANFAVYPQTDGRPGRMLRARGPCGFHSECPRKYSLLEVNRSAALWDPAHSRDLDVLKERHDIARRACRDSGRTAANAFRRNGNDTGQLQTGGWCLEPPSNKSDAFSSVALSGGGRYYLPKPHVAADSVIVDYLSRILRLCNDPPTCSSLTFLSIVDLGAGVGQYGHALRSRDPRYAWRGYDGAGNIEKITHGLVSFFDFTIPLPLQRADWASTSLTPVSPFAPRQ